MLHQSTELLILLCRTINKQIKAVKFSVRQDFNNCIGTEIIHKILQSFLNQRSHENMKMYKILIKKMISENFRPLILSCFPTQFDETYIVVLKLNINVCTFVHERQIPGKQLSIFLGLSFCSPNNLWSNAWNPKTSKCMNIDRFI